VPNDWILFGVFVDQIGPWDILVAKIDCENKINFVNLRAEDLTKLSSPFCLGCVEDLFGKKWSGLLIEKRKHGN
jgi:hypothetical protein